MASKGGLGHHVRNRSIDRFPSALDLESIDGDGDGIVNDDANSNTSPGGSDRGRSYSNAKDEKEKSGSPHSRSKKEPDTTTRSTRRYYYYLYFIGCFVIIFCMFAIMNSINRVPFSGLESNSLTLSGDESIGEKFTVVLNTFKRHDMLADALAHYSECPQVKFIHVVWCEEEAVPHYLLNRFSHNLYPKIYFDRHKDSLNARFEPLPAHTTTSGVLAVDDDMRVSCGDLALAHEAWVSSPRAIVGFMPRTHLRGEGGWVYRCWWSVWWTGKYSIILTKAAFLHHDYFGMYTNSMPQQVRDYVDHNRNCEDIAMQFLVSNASSLAPIYVKGSLEDLGILGGISTSQNIAKAAHISARSACLNDLTKIYGRNPLKYSHRLVDSANSFFGNTPSTLFEYISSDLWSRDKGDQSFLKAAPQTPQVVNSNSINNNNRNGPALVIARTETVGHNDKEKDSSVGN